MRNRLTLTLIVLTLVTLMGLGTDAWAGQNGKKSQSELGSTENRDARRLANLNEEVRHQLVMLPYYSVFDWLEAEVNTNGEVILKGMVVEPTLKSSAEFNIKKLESVTKVTNNIEVLPLSGTDDQLRRASYRAIYSYDTPLFKYALQSVPPIHIIVKNGHVQLKGIVLNQADGQIATMAARQIPGVFDVRNELQVEKSGD